jgi:hypothetical protein
MPGVSGIECVRALVGLGWMPAWWTDRECQLEKESLAVTIPLDQELSSEKVTAIAGLAGVPPIAFVNGLETILTQRMSAYATALGELRRVG